MGMADHFFNNAIATNMIHVVTKLGADEMQIIRILVAQLISFIAVYVYYRKFNTKLIISP